MSDRPAPGDGTPGAPLTDGSRPTSPADLAPTGSAPRWSIAPVLAVAGLLLAAIAFLPSVLASASAPPAATRGDGAPGAIGEVSTEASTGASGAAVTAPQQTAPAESGGGGDSRPIAQLADPTWLNEVAARTGIPVRSLAAYTGAALATAATDPGCHLGWNTLAAIGSVESNHGRHGGSALDANGVATPTIVGIPLTGEGTTRVSDTDGGRVDGDTVWDRAVGPMQFIPSTWVTSGQDGNRDGVKDPNQIDDAALAAAGYLCRAGGDLSQDRNWIAAIGAYNDSIEYNNMVAAAATQYAAASR